MFVFMLTLCYNATNMLLLLSIAPFSFTEMWSKSLAVILSHVEFDHHTYFLSEHNYKQLI